MKGFVASGRTNPPVDGSRLEIILGPRTREPLDTQNHSLTHRRLRVLAIEDDANDVELLRLVFRPLPGVHLDAVFNGREAVDAIIAHSDQDCWPELILCDLNMPVMNGFEFLKWLKHESPCPRTPLVVLSSSAVETDVAKAYDLGAAAYLVKPSSHEELVALAKALVNFWGLVQAPPLWREE